MWIVHECKQYLKCFYFFFLIIIMITILLTAAFLSMGFYGSCALESKRHILNLNLCEPFFFRNNCKEKKNNERNRTNWFIFLFFFTSVHNLTLWPLILPASKFSCSCKDKIDNILVFIQCVFLIFFQHGPCTCCLHCINKTCSCS